MRRPSARRALVLLAATLVALLASAGTASAKKRCCFRAVVSASGFMESTWGQLSNAQIGGDTALWSWSERHILVYEERDGTPSLRAARIDGEPVPASSIYFGATHSTVQWGGPDNYRPAADPGACGPTSLKLRDGVTPELVPRNDADQGAQRRFPNPVKFLSVGSSAAGSSGLGKDCLYGHHVGNIEGWDDQACPGQGHFWLPAPRRAWLNRGENPIEKSVRCIGGHEPAENVNHKFKAEGSGSVRLSWFPPRRLEQEAERLKKVHKETQPGN